MASSRSRRSGRGTRSSRRRPSPAAPGRSSSRPRRSRKPLWIGLAVVAAAVLGVVGWLGYEASQAQRAIASATDEAQELQSQITGGETERAGFSLAALQESTTLARTRTDGPLWDAAAALPFVGASVSAVQTASDSIDDIAQRGLPPIVDLGSSLDSNLFRPTDGRFPVQRFAELAPPVTTAAEVLTENRERIDGIDDDDLVGPVKAPVADLKEKLGTAQRAAAAAAKGLRIAPTLLGADGERTYLLMFQNNAESRALGGIPGALALVTADDGELEFDQQFTISDIGAVDEPVRELTANERRTYDPTMATDIRNVTYTPDFRRTAAFARGIVDETLDVDVDGVLSVDPVALSYALEGTGPIEVGDGTTLTSDNAVEILLNTVYARYPDPQVQDAFFADAAQRVFTSVLSGTGDSRKTLEGLVKADGERRILLWTTDEAAEAELEGTRLGGTLPGATATPHVGVYLNDATESKMQYYLQWDTTVSAEQCTDDGVQTLVATTTLTSTAPEDASRLPEYITGTGKRVETGDQQLNVRVFAPWEGDVEKLEVDGQRRAFGVGRSGERPVMTTPVQLAPGESVELKVTMTSGAGQRRGPVVTTTPGVRSFDQDRRFGSACD